MLKKNNGTHNQTNIKEKNSTVNYFFNSDFSDSEEEKLNDDRKNEYLSNFNIPNYDELIKMGQ